MGQENGVLLYVGDYQHLAVELFRGRTTGWSCSPSRRTSLSAWTEGWPGPLSTRATTNSSRCTSRCSWLACPSRLGSRRSSFGTSGTRPASTAVSRRCTSTASWSTSCKQQKAVTKLLLAVTCTRMSNQSPKCSTLAAVTNAKRVNAHQQTRGRRVTSASAGLAMRAGSARLKDNARGAEVNVNKRQKMPKGEVQRLLHRT